MDLIEAILRAESFELAVAVVGASSICENARQLLPRRLVGHEFWRCGRPSWHKAVHLISTSPFDNVRTPQTLFFSTFLRVTSCNAPNKPPLRQISATCPLRARPE